MTVWMMQWLRHWSLSLFLRRDGWCSNDSIVKTCQSPQPLLTLTTAALNTQPTVRLVSFKILHLHWIFNNDSQWARPMSCDQTIPIFHKLVTHHFYQNSILSICTTPSSFTSLQQYFHKEMLWSWFSAVTGCLGDLPLTQLSHLAQSRTTQLSLPVQNPFIRTCWSKPLLVTFFFSSSSNVLFGFSGAPCLYEHVDTTNLASFLSPGKRCGCW